MRSMNFSHCAKERLVVRSIGSMLIPSSMSAAVVSLALCRYQLVDEVHSPHACDVAAAHHHDAAIYRDGAHAVAGTGHRLEFRPALCPGGEAFDVREEPVTPGVVALATQGAKAAADDGCSMARPARRQWRGGRPTVRGRVEHLVNIQSERLLVATTQRMHPAGEHGEGQVVARRWHGRQLGPGIGGWVVAPHVGNRAALVGATCHYHPAVDSNSSQATACCRHGCTEAPCSGGGIEDLYCVGC